MEKLLLTQMEKDQTFMRKMENMELQR